MEGITWSSLTLRVMARYAAFVSISIMKLFLAAAWETSRVKNLFHLAVIVGYLKVYMIALCEHSSNSY